MANSFWKGFLLNQPPHTPYYAAAVPGIDTISSYLSNKVYYEGKGGKVGEP